MNLAGHAAIHMITCLPYTNSPHEFEQESNQHATIFETLIRPDTSNSGFSFHAD